MVYRYNNFALNSDAYIVIHNKIRSMIDEYNNEKIKEEIRKINSSFTDNELDELIREIRNNLIQ